MEADHAGMVTDACAALVAAQDSANESVRILAGHAALVMDEMDALRAKLADVERERDELLNEPVAKLADLAAAQADNARLRGALEALWNDVGGGKKSCGHAHSCICAGELVRAALSAPSDTSSLAAHDDEVIERCAKALVESRTCKGQHSFQPSQCETCYWFDCGSAAIRALKGGQ